MEYNIYENINNINIMKKQMTFDIKDKKELIFIALISIALVVYYINFNMKLGIYCSDIYVYLLNALYFAGINIHSTKSIYLSPVVCFLTSILFDLGYIDKISIFIVTGIFAIIGNMGLYLLLKLKFNNLLSLTGSVLFSTFSLNLTWLANGSLDIPAVALSIWVVYFLFLALIKNPKYYILVFPFLVIGFFTRYSVIIMSPALLLCYLFYNSFKIKKNDLKYILIGLALSILLIIIILTTISIMGNGYFGFDSQIINGISGPKGSTVDPAYNPDITYYLFNMGNFISSSDTTFIGKTPSLNTPTILSTFILLILVVGLLLWIRRTEFNFNLVKIIGIILCFIAAITFNQFSSTITIILVCFGLLLIAKNSDNKMALFMLSWFLVYFIFMSYNPVKVNRYIIPALPALTYFIMLGVSEINEKLNRKYILPVILISLFLIQGFAFTYTFENTNEFNAPEKMSNYIKENVDNWSDIKIGNYNIRPYYWYLGLNTPGIEHNNQQKIIESNVSYYISNIKQENLTNFTEIKEIDGLFLYQRT